MGCVVSSEGDDDRRRRIIGVSAAGSHHHIVSLTSSTYGILTAPRAYSDVNSSPAVPATAVTAPLPPPPPPPPPQQQQQSPEMGEVINAWELMAGLLDPCTPAKTRRRRVPLRAIDPPPAGDGGDKGGVVLYTTSLRVLRGTFEACNAVRAALQAHGVAFRERDVSMDRGFREELLRLLSPVEAKAGLPRLFVRGRYVGGAEEVLRLDEEGKLAPLLEALPRARGGVYSCDGCGGMRFLPCFDCAGSRKLAVPLQPNDRRKKPQLMVVRCRECNENGLVLCPICS